MHRNSLGDCRDDRRSIETRLSYYDQTPRAFFAGPPGAIKMLTETPTNPLNKQPHRFVSNREKSLHSKHIVTLRNRREFGDKSVRISDRPGFDDKRLKLVVIVILLVVVVGLTRVDIVLAGGREPEEDLGVNTPFAGCDDLYCR